MDIYHLSIPALVDNFYLDTDRPQIAAKMKQIYATYKNEIDTVSALTHVPVTLILSIISIESNGQPTVVSGAGAVGLMQLVPSSANGILVIEKTVGRITPQEQDILAKNIGDRFTKGIMKMRYQGHQVTVNGVTGSNWITKADLLIPIVRYYRLKRGSLHLDSTATRRTS